MKNLLWFLSLPFLYLYDIFLSGFVINKIWGWFVTPTFNVPAPELLYCTGLSILTHYLTVQPACVVLNDDKKTKNTRFALKLILPWVTLLFAYLLHIIIGIKIDVSL